MSARTGVGTIRTVDRRATRVTDQAEQMGTDMAIQSMQMMVFQMVSLAGEATLGIILLGMLVSQLTTK